MFQMPKTQFVEDSSLGEASSAVHKVLSTSTDSERSSLDRPVLGWGWRAGLRAAPVLSLIQSSRHFTAITLILPRVSALFEELGSPPWRLPTEGRRKPPIRGHF